MTFPGKPGWWWCGPIGLVLGVGCATAPTSLYSNGVVSPAPAIPWVPPPPSSSEVATVPPEFRHPESSRQWSLPELIDAGLADHPGTRAAWLAARSAAYGWGAEKGAVYPSVRGSAFLSRSRVGAGSQGEVLEHNTFGPGLEISYLLLDFGGRRAVIEQARQNLLAANWTHNAAIADRVLAVTEAYHRHQAALAALEAQRAVVEEAKATLEAAEDRRRLGAATLSDVLQAKTALSRAELALATDEGRSATTRGELNAAVGRPANQPLLLEPWPGELPLAEVENNVDEMVAAAAAHRPEIAAARAQVVQAEAKVRAVHSEGLPSVNFSGLTGRTYSSDPSNHFDTYGAVLTLRFPLFTGFAQPLNERRAQMDLELSRARLDAARRQVELEAFQSAHDLRTAARRLVTSRTLLESAARNQEVASARYKAGAGTIVELLTAQSALEDARAQEVQARADWMNALARLARDIGETGPVPEHNAAVAAEVMEQ